MQRQKLELKLFVSGMTPASEHAMANVCRVLRAQPNGGFELHVIDVLEHPEFAERDKILATPTLVREQPLPRRIMIGDLAEELTLCSFLGLEQDSHGEK